MKFTPRELKGNVNVSHNSPMKEFFVLFGSIMGIILVVYLVLGFVVDLVVPRLSIEAERSLGKLYSGFYKNEIGGETTEKCKEILGRLQEKMLERRMPYRVHVVRGPENAVALPGGDIIVFTELIKGIESENELAFVIAHELGHFAHRDHLRGLGRGLVLWFLATVISGTDSPISEILGKSLVNIRMKFSQHQEKMADLFALELLNRHYGHVAGALDFMEKMAKKEKRSRLLYYFATHPYPQDRVKVLRNKIREEGFVIKEKILFNDKEKGN